MVQTYGVAESRDDLHDNSHEDSQGESSALLGLSSATGATTPKSDGSGTIVSSVSNLANTIIGSGTIVHVWASLLDKNTDQRLFLGMLTFPLVSLIIVKNGVLT